MFNKYEVKTYPECIQNEISDLEQDSKNIPINNSVTVNNNLIQDKYIKNTFQPKVVFTKQNDNISFYQSSSKDCYRPINNNNKKSNPKIMNKNKKSINRQQYDTSPIYTYGEEKFSYNYTNTNTTYDTKNSSQNSKKDLNLKEKRVNLNEHYNQKQNKTHKPKRTIKSCKKNELNVEKSDNFNVLSYRPIQYESDINNNQDTSKIIQIYKKQDVDEIFFPSKRTHSPLPKVQTSISKEKTEKYQTSSLRHQSFFGSFNSLKHSKQAKSTSRINVNQLEDFNIDKLIEIGDKYANLCEPVLPLGKIMNNNIIYFGNKIKNFRNKIPVNKNNYNNNNNEFKNDSEYSKVNKKKFMNQNYVSDESKVNDLNLNNNDKSKDSKRVTKKIISKKYMKNQNKKPDNRDSEEEVIIKKNLNFNTEVMEANDLVNKSGNMNNTNFKTRKKQIKKNVKEIKLQKSCDRKNEAPSQIIPKMKITKRKSNINNTNLSKNFGIEKRVSENLEGSTLNNTLNDKKIKNENSEPTILTDDEVNFKNKCNLSNKLRISQIKATTNDIQKNKNSALTKASDNKGSKSKNYYGYEDKQNLEDTINNHSYFESVHSKKKINNCSLEKNV